VELLPDFVDLLAVVFQIQKIQFDRLSPAILLLFFTLGITDHLTIDRHRFVYRKIVIGVDPSVDHRHGSGQSLVVSPKNFIGEADIAPQHHVVQLLSLLRELIDIRLQEIHFHRIEKSQKLIESPTRNLVVDLRFGQMSILQKPTDGAGDQAILGRWLGSLEDSRELFRMALADTSRQRAKPQGHAQ